MKSKIYLVIALAAITLISVQCTKKAKVETGPFTCGINIDLKSFYPADTLTKINTRIYDAALKGEIKAYKDGDSFTSFYTKEEMINRGASEQTVQISDPKNNTLIDSVVRVPFNPKEITIDMILYALKYDEKKDEIIMEIKGFAPVFNLKIAGIELPPQGLFYVSKEDIFKLFGQKAATELFENCFKAMLKKMNYDKTKTVDKTTAFYLNMDEFIGCNILENMNKNLYKLVTKGIDGAVPLKAYQNEDLAKTLTAEEIEKRGCTEEAVQVPVDPKDPNSMLIDTIILNPLRLWEHKYYSISLVWSYDAKKLTAYPKINAIGMALQSRKDNKTMYKPIFWFDWKDADKVYNQFELSVMKYTVFKAIENYTWLKP